MKGSTTLLFPVVLYLSLDILVFLPGAPAWPGHETFLLLPYLLGIVAFVLGAFLHQSRISLLALLIMGVSLLVQGSVFGDRSGAGNEAILFLAGIYVPPFTVLFHHLGERGLFNRHGMVRGLAVFSAVGMMGLLSMIPSLQRAMQDSTSVWFRSASAIVAIPLATVVTFAVCLPLLWVRNPHESPAMGKLLSMFFLFVLTALNFRSSFWRAEAGHTVYLLFLAGAVVTLVWVIVESAWRNASIDELTELPGRRALKHRLARLGDRYALAILDIDHFKKINDRFGHDTGDQVLRFIASHLKKTGAGEAHRYGGEEFVVVIEDADLDRAFTVAEEIRRRIADSRFVVRAKGRPTQKPERAAPPTDDLESRMVRVTCSLGVAAGTAGASPWEVLDRADKALYRAKKDGRNCTKSAR